MNIQDAFRPMTPGWMHARIGKATASRIHDIVAKTKTGWAASRTNYMAEIIVERLTGYQSEHFHTKAMEDGIRREPHAKIIYRARTNMAVQDAGFVQHPTIAMAGASPDGLVGDDGLVQFKCPYAATHLEMLLGQDIPVKYFHQMQWEMACCPERQWSDFVDFDERFPPSMQLMIKRVERDNAVIRQLEHDVGVFLQEVDSKLAELYRIYDTA